MNIIFDIEKETKGTFRFTERVAKGKSAVVGTLYVRKDSELGKQFNPSAPSPLFINASFLATGGSFVADSAMVDLSETVTPSEQD